MATPMLASLQVLWPNQPWYWHVGFLMAVAAVIAGLLQRSSPRPALKTTQLLLTASVLAWMVVIFVIEAAHALQVAT